MKLTMMIFATIAVIASATRSATVSDEFATTTYAGTCSATSRSAEHCGRCDPIAHIFAGRSGDAGIFDDAAVVACEIPAQIDEASEDSLKTVSTMANNNGHGGRGKIQSGVMRIANLNGDGGHSKYEMECAIGYGLVQGLYNDADTCLACAEGCALCHSDRFGRSGVAAMVCDRAMEGYYLGADSVPTLCHGYTDAQCAGHMFLKIGVTAAEFCPFYNTYQSQEEAEVQFRSASLSSRNGTARYNQYVAGVVSSALDTSEVSTCKACPSNSSANKAGIAGCVACPALANASPNTELRCGWTYPLYPNDGDMTNIDDVESDRFDVRGPVVKALAPGAVGTLEAFRINLLGYCDDMSPICTLSIYTCQDSCWRHGGKWRAPINRMECEYGAVDYELRKVETVFEYINNNRQSRQFDADDTGSILLDKEYFWGRVLPYPQRTGRFWVESTSRCINKYANYVQPEYLSNDVASTWGEVDDASTETACLTAGHRWAPALELADDEGYCLPGFHFQQSYTGTLMQACTDATKDTPATCVSSCSNGALATQSLCVAPAVWTERTWGDCTDLDGDSSVTTTSPGLNGVASSDCANFIAPFNAICAPCDNDNCYDCDSTPSDTYNLINDSPGSRFNGPKTASQIAAIQRGSSDHCSQANAGYCIASDATGHQVVTQAACESSCSNVALATQTLCVAPAVWVTRTWYPATRDSCTQHCRVTGTDQVPVVQYAADGYTKLTDVECEQRCINLPTTHVCELETHFNTEAKCELAGGTWLTAGDDNSVVGVDSVCSNSTYTTSTTCRNAGFTWGFSGREWFDGTTTSGSFVGANRLNGIWQGACEQAYFGYELASGLFSTSTTGPRQYGLSMTNSVPDIQMPGGENVTGEVKLDVCEQTSITEYMMPAQLGVGAIPSTDQTCAVAHVAPRSAYCESLSSTNKIARVANHCDGLTDQQMNTFGDSTLNHTNWACEECPSGFAADPRVAVCIKQTRTTATNFTQTIGVIDNVNDIIDCENHSELSYTTADLNGECWSAWDNAHTFEAAHTAGLITNSTTGTAVRERYQTYAACRAQNMFWKFTGMGWCHTTAGAPAQFFDEVSCVAQGVCTDATGTVSLAHANNRALCLAVGNVGYTFTEDNVWTPPVSTSYGCVACGDIENLAPGASTECEITMLNPDVGPVTLEYTNFYGNGSTVTDGAVEAFTQEIVTDQVNFRECADGFVKQDDKNAECLFDPSDQAAFLSIFTTNGGVQDSIGVDANGYNLLNNSCSGAVTEHDTRLLIDYAAAVCSDPYYCYGHESVTDEDLCIAFCFGDATKLTELACETDAGGNATGNVWRTPEWLNAGETTCGLVAGNVGTWNAYCHDILTTDASNEFHDFTLQQIDLSASDGYCEGDLQQNRGGCRSGCVTDLAVGTGDLLEACVGANKNWITRTWKYARRNATECIATCSLDDALNTYAVPTRAGFEAQDPAECPIWDGVTQWTVREWRPIASFEDICENRVYDLTTELVTQYDTQAPDINGRIRDIMYKQPVPILMSYALTSRSCLFVEKTSEICVPCVDTGCKLCPGTGENDFEEAAGGFDHIHSGGCAMPMDGYYIEFPEVEGFFNDQTVNSEHSEYPLYGVTHSCYEFDWEMCQYNGHAFSNSDTSGYLHWNAARATSFSPFAIGDDYNYSEVADFVDRPIGFCKYGRETDPLHANEPLRTILDAKNNDMMADVDIGNDGYFNWGGNYACGLTNFSCSILSSDEISNLSSHFNHFNRETTEERYENSTLAGISVAPEYSDHSKDELVSFLQERGFSGDDLTLALDKMVLDDSQMVTLESFLNFYENVCLHDDLFTASQCAVPELLVVSGASAAAPTVMAFAAIAVGAMLM